MQHHRCHDIVCICHDILSSLLVGKEALFYRLTPVFPIAFLHIIDKRQNQAF